MNDDSYDLRYAQARSEAAQHYVRTLNSYLVKMSSQQQDAFWQWYEASPNLMDNWMNAEAARIAGPEGGFHDTDRVVNPGLGTADSAEHYTKVVPGGASPQVVANQMKWTQPLPSFGWLKQWAQAHGFDTSTGWDNVNPADQNIPSTGNDPDPTHVQQVAATVFQHLYGAKMPAASPSAVSRVKLAKPTIDDHQARAFQAYMIATGANGKTVGNGQTRQITPDELNTPTGTGTTGGGGTTKRI